jgi:hypothetical protein
MVNYFCFALLSYFSFLCWHHDLPFPLIGKKTHGENVAERDFLRTEGDPSAVGYSINEALALTRSMVRFINFIRWWMGKRYLACGWIQFHI